MKKFKKLLAGILAGAMMLGSMTTTAFADEGAGATKRTVTPATINTELKGSLTINKYEGKDGDKSKPLENVTFTIYKIATIEQVTSGGNNPYTEVQFKPVEAFNNVTITSSTTYEDIKVMVNEAVNNSSLTGQTAITAYNSEKTVASATFSDLELGVYLVVETDAPSQIVNKSANFLVSIPMAETDTDGNAIGWNYDVVANPKNAAVYGEIVLKKEGKIGSNAVTELSGATFVLQKKGTGEIWTTITQNNKGADVGVNGVLTTGRDGDITVSDLAPGTYRFVETGVPSNTGYIMNGEDTKEFEITNEGKVKIGESVNDTGLINVVNYKPNVEKEVKKADGTWGNDSDYSAGDEVPYRVTVDVPENIDKLVDFILTDTMLRQTYVDNSLEIFSNPELTTKILDTKYTVITSEDKTQWSIAFNLKNESGITSLLSAYHGKKIYISFKTKLAEDAFTTEDGNPNTVKLEYSNKILPSSNEDGNPNTPGNPGKDEITDQATVYTFKIAVEKVDAENINTKLEGVKFDLYRKLADDARGENVLTDPVKGLTGKYEKVKADLTTDKKGEVSVNGLKNGTYYLVETKTNNGYNLLQAPVEVKIAATYTTKTTTTTDTDTSGKTTTTTVVSNTKFDKTGENGVFKTVVKNSKGFTLPTTGGMGTVIFSVLGIALVLAGLLVITASRKKAAK